MEGKYELGMEDLKLLNAVAAPEIKSSALFAATASMQQEVRQNRIYEGVKRCVDVVLSSVALVALFPLFVITAIVVKAEDGGPVIHKRHCIKADKSQYIMYKFRSMRVDADDLEKCLSLEQLEEYKKECKLVNDPRITKVGKIIRRFSIDELPQLWSVLKGDMSLIGPRPIVEFETSFWGNDIDKVLSVPPGITGYWQINGRSDATYETGKRQELEMYYVEHRGFRLDIKILLGTVKAVFSGKGAR